MISISVSGVLVAKPQVVNVGSGNSRKCEFTVFDLRRVRVGDTWQPVWERVVFVAWDGEADRVALIMSKGAHVSCTGLQETHQLVDSQGERRLAVKYRLTAWSVNYRQRWTEPAMSSSFQPLTSQANAPPEATTSHVAAGTQRATTS